MPTPLERLRHHVTGAIERGEAEAITEVRAAPPYDFAVLDNAEKPRSIVYHLDTGAEVATFDTSPDGQAMAERVCGTLNAYCEEMGIS
jgi:hypothetical protein